MQVYKAYRVQREKAGKLPPRRWRTIKAQSAEDAAIAYLRRIKPSAEAFPITIHVAKGKAVWPTTGAPMITTGLKFGLCE